MEWRLNGGDRTLNFDSVQNLYVREKNGHIDKVGTTNWPTLMKIKHFIVEMFTDFKYFEGQDAFLELKRNSKEVEANSNIDFSNSEHNLNPFGKHISLKIHQVTPSPAKSHASEPIEEFDDDHLHSKVDTVKEQVTPLHQVDTKIPVKEKETPKPQVEEKLPDAHKSSAHIKFTVPKEEPIELPEQGLNKFPSENNPEVKTIPNNEPEPIEEKEPQIPPTVVKEESKLHEAIIPNKEPEIPPTVVKQEPKLNDAITSSVDTKPEQPLQNVTVKATPAQLDETPNRLETLKTFIDEFKTDPLKNPHKISTLIKTHNLDANKTEDLNLLEEIIVYFDRKEPHKIDSDELSDIPDDILLNLYSVLVADRIERGALDNSLGISELRNHLINGKKDLELIGLERALDNPALKAEDIKFYVEKLGMQKNDPQLKELLSEHDYVLTLVTYKEGRATVIKNEYVKSGDVNRYATGGLTYDPSVQSIFA